MAALAALRTALARVGFTAPVAINITDVENIDSLEELKLLSSDDVETLCKTLRSPGGLVNNPNAGIAGQPPQIRNPGRHVSARAEKNMKLTTYFLRHQDHCSRTAQAADITLLNIRPMTDLMDHEKAHDNPDEPKKYEDPKKMVAFLEIFQNYLTQYHGETHIPLSYLIRPAAQPEPEQNDPAANYTSIEEELISRAPHTGPAFVADNRKLWELLYAFLHDTDAYKYIKSSARARDGRGAWTSLTNHVLGTASLDNLTATAERTLRDTFYTGEKRRFDLSKYCGVHKDAHNDLEKAHDQTNGAYPMMDDRSKVRHLLDGIHTKTLDAAKAAIFADPRIRNDYDAAVDLLQTFVTQASTATNDARHVASVGQHGGRGRGGDPGGRGHRSGRHGRGGGRGGRGGGRGGYQGRGGGGRGRGRGRGRGNGGRHEPVSDRYYTPQEFEALGPENRKQVFELREQRDTRRNVAATATTTDNQNATIAALTLALNHAQERNVSAATAAEEEVPVTNRTNPALNRPILRSAGGRG
jgi:hypothetical protein